MTDVIGQPTTAATGRPLVPTRREEGFGRVADAVDLSIPQTHLVRSGSGEDTATRRDKWIGFLRGLSPFTIPGPMKPLFILSFVSMIGSLNGFVFKATQIASPEIQKSIGVASGTIASLTVFASIATNCTGPWLGYVADRRNRVMMTRIGTAIQSIGLMLTAVAGGVGSMFGGNTISGMGQKVNMASTQTLLTDYYDLLARIRVIFFLFQVEGFLGLLATPIAAVLVDNFGWRTVFFFTGIALASGIILLFFLRETPRGYWERRALGAPHETAAVEQEPLTWSECWRTASSIKLVQRQWLAAPFLVLPSSFLLTVPPLYFANTFGLAIGQRSGIQFTQDVFGFLALIILGPIAQRLVSHKPRTVVFLQATQALVTATLFSLMLVTHQLWLAIILVVAIQMVASTLFTVTFALTFSTLPARMRSFGLQSLYFAGVPGSIVLGLGFLNFNGFSQVILGIVIASVIACIIQLTALPHVERDIANATSAAMVDQEIQQLRENDDRQLIVRSLDVSYSGAQVLFGVDLDVKRGEIVALLGTNGAGKSTLLRAIAGVHEPTGGVIFLDGRDITHTPPHESAKAGVVVVPGGHSVCAGMTVTDNLKVAAWLHRDDDAYVEERLAHALELFPRLSERLDADAGNLSGGEQQMLALAQSYLMEPRLLMIDELSLGLAPQVVESLLDSLRAINAAGTTILLVEQSINVALTIATRAVFLDKGQVRFDGPTHELLQRPDLVRAIFMGGASATGRGRRRTSSGLGQESERYLQVEDVSVTFGGIQALDGVSLEVAPREIVGLIGPNGAGKTTLFDAISGLVPTDGGRVLLKGVDVSGLTLDRRAAAGLGRSFQSARLFPSMTVRENIAVAMQRRVRARNPLLAAFWAPPVRAEERKVNERVDDIIELLGLGAFADKFVGELSTGSRRAVDVGAIMVASPDVLLLDEPSSGLAQAETEALGPVIQRIVRETGCAVLLIEHDLPLVTSVSHRLVAMELGRVIASGPAEDVLNHPEVQRAYLSASREVLLRSDSAFADALAAAGFDADTPDPGSKAVVT
jgi:ABC-type branched-subunit amino acid transport system ATPase component/sugar phosphate permease